MNDEQSRVVVVGNRDLARHVLVHLFKQGWNVVGAVGAAGDAASRQAGFVPFDKLAQSYGVKIIETGDLNAEKSQTSLSELNPDICICPGWHQILERPVLNIPTYGFLGFHSSDLPRGRGGAPINWSLINGKDEITISLFRYTPGVDAGAIIDKETVPIKKRDDIRTVIDRLAIAACDAVSSIREEIERGRLDSVAVAQSEMDATYRPRRQPQDGIIDWNSAASDVWNWVRAQTDPYPGAYTFFKDGKLVIWSAKSLKNVENKSPGTIINTTKEGIDVAVADGGIRLKRVQPDRSPRMWGDEFVERYGIKEGDTFGKAHAPSSWLYTGIRNRYGGTDLTETTNVSIGEKIVVQALIWSGKNQEILVKGRCSGLKFISETIRVDGEKRIPLEYEPEDTGTKTLVIEFYTGDERIDVRYLKLFVH